MFGSYWRDFEVLGGATSTIREVSSTKKTEKPKETIPVYGPEYIPDYGPPSPESISKLDRALTPAEQKVVENWQEFQANQQLAAVRSQGGPKSETVAVTPQGAVLRAEEPIPVYGPPLSAFRPVAPTVQKTQGIPTWQIVLAGAGGAAALVLTIALVSSGPRRGTR